jgi:hypothetical protein
MWWLREPQEPASDFERREARRRKRMWFFFYTLPILTCVVLFFSFFLYYMLAPWEVAYRQHVAAVLQAQIEALPPYNTDRLQQILVRSRDGLSVSADYSRHEVCAPIMGYYRQLTPAHGWTYTRSERYASHTSVNNIDTSESIDYYDGHFEGYQATLMLDCSMATFGYGILVTSKSQLCLWSCPALDTRSSSAYRPSSSEAMRVRELNNPNTAPSP